MRFSYRSGGWTAAISAALAICVSASGWAQQPSSSKPDHPASQESTAASGAKPEAEKDSAKSRPADPKRQVNDDAARLLELATELKAEVDKTNKDTLSLKVIREAETIEKLAKGVRQQLKQNGGAS